MTSNHDNTNPSNEEDGAFIGIPPDHLLNYLAHLAEGNLIALVRLTAVVEHLRTTAFDTQVADLYGGFSGDGTWHSCLFSRARRPVNADITYH
jgi:hypothetical protein